MTRRWRWSVVVATIAVLVALPFAAQLLPAGNSSVSPAALLARIRASAAVPYSGYVQTQGGLSLPVSNTPFSEVSDLLGGTDQLRVWWRGDSDWRVDTLAVTGEQDDYQDASGLWSWDYEANTATRLSSDRVPLVREPRSGDLVPGNLARRLLSEVDTSAVTRLPDARIAGRDAAGLRVRVTDPQSTIRHIDVWALASSGLPLRVSVWGTSTRPLVTSSLLDLDTGEPSAATTSFTPPAGADVRRSDFGDIVAAIDHFGSSRPPERVAGLNRRRDLDLGAVGVYGRGVTLVVAVPVPAQLADQFVQPLLATRNAVQNSSGISTGISALNIQLSNPSRFGDRWLLVGTVTRATLRAALARLPAPNAFGPRSGH